MKHQRVPLPLRRRKRTVLCLESEWSSLEGVPVVVEVQGSAAVGAVPSTFEGDSSVPCFGSEDGQHEPVGRKNVKNYGKFTFKLEANHGGPQNLSLLCRCYTNSHPYSKDSAAYHSQCHIESSRYHCYVYIYLTFSSHY